LDGATEAQILANRRNAPKLVRLRRIEFCSTLSLPVLSIVEGSKGLPCVAFCEAGSSLGPLHLSRTLYKSALFMLNKANLPDAQMNVSSFLTKYYENLPLRRRGENKPNLSRRSLWRSRIKPNLKIFPAPKGLRRITCPWHLFR